MALARTPRPPIIDDYFLVREFGWTQPQIAQCDEWWLRDIWTAHQIRLAAENSQESGSGDMSGGVPLSEAFPDAPAE